MKPYTKTFSHTFSAQVPEAILQWCIIGAGVWLAATVVGAGVKSLRTSGRAAAAIQDYSRSVSDSVKPGPEVQETLRKLTQNNLFMPVPEKTKPPQCLAILGDTALFNDKWYKVGETVGGAEIVAVGPRSVTILFEEKEQTLAPFEADIKPEQSGGRGGPSPAPAAATPSRSGPPDGARRRMESITPEQRQQMMEHYRNASPQERAQMREQMREQFRQSREP